MSRRGLERLWRPGQRYVKTGVVLTELRPAGLAQLGLFEGEAVTGIGASPLPLPDDRRAAVL